ncbi:tetratricopeptide repeat protein [Fodinibius sp.]|uniref:tetratricopeptide repeat protein n=1 Tax=Fodinibius sp. TaxID=1872440 RepID=UPI0035634DC3
MMNSYTRIASLVLAFGFFFGCSGTKNSTDDTTDLSSGDSAEARLEQRVSAIDQQLQSDPYNPSLYFEKGEQLIKWAREKEDPDQRMPLYTEANLVLEKADSLLKTQPDSSVDTLHYDQLRKVAWSSEHNRGIEQYRDASSEEDYRLAAIYFNNATTIMPDEPSSYQMAGKAYFEGDELQQAIAILDRGRINVKPPPVDLLESLAFLYVETDQLQNAIMIYKEARSRREHSFNLMHGLSNAYIEAEDHHNAITILQELSNRKPNNITYRYSLASEYYKAGREELIAIAGELEEDREFNAADFAMADSLFNQAENYYIDIVDSRSGDAHYLYETVQFYHNKAAQYQRLLPYLDQQRETQIKKHIEQNISASVPLLEQLTEQHPTEQMWKYLYRTYSYLGMQEEAEKAKANY